MPPTRHRQLARLVMVLCMIGTGAGAGILLVRWAWPPGADRADVPGTSGDPATGFREESVAFAGGGNTLAGVLVLPDRPGPHLAVVFIHGSDGAERTGRGRWPVLWQHFARHGFASLSWDRPGVGASTGDFEQQTFADRAAEAVAAVAWLRARPDIRHGAVGLWGFSQGGGVVPLAASQSAEVRFVIAVSGFQEVAWKQDLYRVEAELRADGFGEPDIDEATAFARRRMDLIRGPGDFDELDQAQQQVRGRGWFDYVHYCDRKRFEAGRRMVEFDPGPCWECVRCPVLAIYGTNDTSSPVDRCVAVIRRGLQRAGNNDVQVKVFPKADHLITLSETGGRKEAGRRAAAPQGANEPNFAPGYLDLMSGWLNERFAPAR